MARRPKPVPQMTAAQFDAAFPDVHTNTIEGLWSIFKRGIVGSFHKVSAKYMPLYVAEFQFRYNNRENVDIFGAAVARC